MPEYYDINIQIWTDGTAGSLVYYSVIQENAEKGKPEPLVWGEANSFEDALTIAKEAVVEALTVKE